MGGYPEEGMPLLATVDPVWIRCGCAVGVPKAVYTCYLCEPCTVLWDCTALAQCTLVLLQRGIAISGVCVCVCLCMGVGGEAEA